MMSAPSLSDVISAPSTAVNKNKKETILFVEDDPELRTMLSYILVEAGYQVFEASSECQARLIWKHRKHKINLILTDVCIPHRSTGVGLAKKLRRQKPDLKVIYISGFGIELVANELSSSDELNYVRKPFHPGALLETIRKCLDRPQIAELNGDRTKNAGAGVLLKVLFGRSSLNSK